MNIREIRKINATKHGGYGTSLYGVWNSMKQRCNNPSVKTYRYYGGKGIKVFPKWGQFESFRDWAIDNGYEEGLTLDRINSNEDYEPSNCRWVTLAEQQRNKSNNVMLTYEGETHCAKEWSELLGINYKTIMTRLSRGWSSDRIFSTNGDARRTEVTHA